MKTLDAGGVSEGVKGYEKLPTGSRGMRDASSFKLHREPLRPPEQRKGNYKNILDLGGIWAAEVC